MGPVIISGPVFLIVMEININLRMDDEQYRHLVWIIKKEGDRIMSALTDLQRQFDAAMAKAVQAFTDASTALDALAQKAADLTAQVAAGNPVDPAELAALETDIATQSTALSTIVDELEGKIAIDNPTPPPPPPPPAAATAVVPAPTDAPAPVPAAAPVPKF